MEAKQTQTMQSPSFLKTAYEEVKNFWGQYAVMEGQKTITRCRKNILRQFHPPIILTNYLPKTYLNVILLFPRSFKWLFWKRYLHQNFIFNSCVHIWAACPAHHKFLNLNTLTIVCDLYKSQSFSLNILNWLLLSVLLGLSVFLSTMFSNTCNLWSPKVIRHFMTTELSTFLPLPSWQGKEFHFWSGSTCDIHSVDPNGGMMANREGIQTKSSICLTIYITVLNFII
jgi:hypothetical protein